MGLIGQPNISNNYFHSLTVHLDIIGVLLSTDAQENAATPPD
jgi:hypothetical protein